MLNSQQLINHFASGLGSDDIDFHDIKMHQLSYTQTESRPTRLNSSKSSTTNHPGSSSNSNSSSNGVYVDMGKVLLEAAKSGDSDKVQECVKNGAPFITDWVRDCNTITRDIADLNSTRFSLERPRFTSQLKTTSTILVQHCSDQGSARMPRRRLIELLYTSQYSREIMRFASFCCNTSALLILWIW